MEDGNFLDKLQEFQRLGDINAIYELYHKASETQKVLIKESISLFRTKRFTKASRPVSGGVRPVTRSGRRILSAKSTDPNVFRDTGRMIYSFLNRILVVCSKCKKQAEIRPLTGNGNSPIMRMFAPRRLVCCHCGETKEWDGMGIHYPQGKIVDGYFNRPLWLQTPCCGNVLWAYNGQHLILLERFVQAKVRERATIRNKTLVNALPAWIKSAKNRNAVLKATKRLKDRLVAD
jgi:hypothetical protein